MGEGVQLNEEGEEESQSVKIEMLEVKRFFLIKLKGYKIKIRC